MSVSSSASAAQNTAEPFHEIVDFFRSDEEIAKATPAEEFANFFNYDKDWVSAVKSAVEYQEFDTKVIISQLVENSASYLARNPEDLKYELRLKLIGDKSNCYTNKEHLQHDMHCLVIAGLTRNSNMQKIIAKAHGPGKELFKMLQEKYDIKDGGNSLESKVITLPRIARAYPRIGALLFHKKAVIEIVPYNTFPGRTKPKTHAICYPLLQSVCPFTLKAENNFHPVMLWLQIKLDDIIHRQDGKTTSLSQILRYYFATYHSTALPEATRLKIFSRLDIITQEETCSGQNWKLTQRSAQLAANCLSELYNMRKDDEKHDLLMTLAKSGDI